MPKDSIVEIPSGSGNRYRYEYSEGQTLYRGPVGSAPEIGEQEFLKALDRPEVRRIREEIQIALDGIEDTEVKFTVGSASYSTNTATFKVEAATVGETGEVHTKTSEDFKLYASRWGLKPEDLGKKVRISGKVMTIVGGKPRSKKYPIMVEDASGKIYKVSADAAKYGMMD